MKNAGLKKYSMELGGKSPVLIFEDADIERALDAALFTIFSINGERCTAGSRIFIQQSIYRNSLNALPNALTACASAIRPIRIPRSGR